MRRIYIKKPVGRRELRRLLQIGRAEERAFFYRNPHLVRPYRGRLLAIALCQGAALQFLKCGYGVKDFDLHFFYAQNPMKPRLSRAVGRIRADVGSFSDIPVDFIRTVIPGSTVPKGSGAVIRHIRHFLDSRPTANALHLARKAVVGLYPAPLFGKEIWRNETNCAV